MEKNNIDQLKSCIIRIEVSSIFGAWPILDTKRQDKCAFDASILMFFFWELPNFMEVQY